MTTPTRNAQEWLRDGRAAVRAAGSRALPARGWEALQESDGEGNPTGPLPYTDEAIREFTAAHTRDPEEVGIAHHLAIAHHARAWDWELQGDPRAAAEWEKAIGFWRQVAASGEFWAAMKTKLLACHAEADAAFLDELRRDLLEHLLEVHVGFVRHYCERDEPERANAHIEIVRRAQLPPAVKSRLVERVFDAMTVAVPETRATGAYEAAFKIIERFLRLFPDHLAALRMHAEIAKERALGLSFQTNWEEIQLLGSRAEPYARRIADHPDLGRQSLACTALEELAFELAFRGHSRGSKFFVAMDSEQIGVANREAATMGLDFAIVWGRLGASHSAPGSQLREIFAASLHGRGVSYYLEAVEVKAADLDEHIQVATTTRLYRDAVSLLEEALDHTTQDAELQDTLKQMRDDLAWLETRLKLIEAERLDRWPVNWEK